MAITLPFCSECSVVPGILCRQTCCKVSLTRWSDRCADERPIFARIDVNVTHQYVTEQCRLAVQAFRQALSAS